MSKDDLNLSTIFKNLSIDVNDPIFLKERLKNGLNKIIDHHCESILPYAAQLCGISEKLIRAKFLGVTIDMEAEINAHLQQFADGSFTVKVHAPLISFVWQCSKLWSTRVSVMATEEYEGEITTVKFVKTFESIKRLMDAFWQGTICNSNTFDIPQLSQNQINFALILTLLAERFILGHEFGHAIIRLNSKEGLNHFEEILDWTRHWSRFYTLEIIDRLGNSIKSHELTNWGINDFADHWGEEFAADNLGMHMALKSAQDIKDSVAGFWAIETLLIMFHLLESYYPYLKGYDLPLNPHPYSKLRLTMIRSAIIDGTPPGVKGVFTIGRFFEQLGDEIIANIKTNIK